MRIAFYAPLKPPDHATPSGDRLMARLLIGALATAGYEVRVASRLRSYASEASESIRRHHEQLAEGEVRSLLTVWTEADASWRPDLWFTYHPYYKAPDWVGPAACERLAIPYATAEASYAAKRDAGPWRAWQAAVVAAIGRAAVNFCLTAVDRAGLERVPGRRGRLVDLPPFIDRSPQAPPRSRESGATRIELISVAMMRGGVKLESYRMLAQALHELCDLPWRLTIVGDGPARPEVAAAFAGLPAERIAWAGALAQDQVAPRLARSDLYLWPGFGEAYGMAYLEAQAEGLPVVAQRTGGIPAVVVDGVTGLLTEPGDRAAFAGAARRLIADPDLRRSMGTAAERFVRGERTLANAATILREALDPLRATVQGAR
jgi:glycosyltransferase involved in cell wall biosynthesis